MNVFLFPGQGSQQKGMGHDLFEEFRDYTDLADRILGYSIEELCIDDPSKQLSKTEFTQPALFFVNALTYLKKCQENKITADFLAGHSLGEYNALFAAGVFDIETGLRLVQKRGALMGKANDGGMAAILGCNIKTLEQALNKTTLNKLDIANYNSPEQCVISGDAAQILEAQKYFEEQGAMFIPLNVSAPFHSRYMRPFVEEYEVFLKKFNLNTIQTPVISNFTAEPYKNSQITYNLKEQLCQPVQWVKSIQYIMKKGHFDFEEIGPGNVLTKLTGNIIKG